MSNILALLLLVAAGFVLAVSVVAAKGGDALEPGSTGNVVTTAPQEPSVPLRRYTALRRRFDRLTLYTVRVERQRNALRRTLIRTPKVTEALDLACATYGHCAELWRKARCESKLRPDPPHNNAARGLLQFLPSTWASTPYAGLSVFSAYANAMAAGWMHARGRGGEWVCQ